MRKRTVKRVFDNIFWYSLYMLPLVVYLVFNVSLFLNHNFIPLDSAGNQLFLGFDYFMQSYFGITTYNPVYLVFENLFTDVGIIMFFENYGVLYYLTYFIAVYLVHLAVDFILFIPRLAHKWLTCFTQGDD